MFLAFCWVDFVGEVTDSYGHSCYSKTDFVRSIHFMKSFFCCWSLAGENLGTTKTPPGHAQETLSDIDWRSTLSMLEQNYKTLSRKYAAFFFFSLQSLLKMKTAESTLFFHVPMIMGLMKNGYVEDLSWMFESPSMLINVATKKHRTKCYQKQPSWTCLWFLFRASNLEAFHESRVTSKHILCMGTASLMFEISGWSLPGIVPKELWESKLPTIQPVVFFIPLRMWCSLSGEKPSSVPFPELVRSVPCSRLGETGVKGWLGHRGVGGIIF